MAQNEDNTPLGYLVNPDTNKRWPVLEYWPDGRLTLFGAYSAFESSVQKAIRSGYILDSGYPELADLFRKTQRKQGSPVSVSLEETERSPVVSEEPAAEVERSHAEK